MTDLPSVTLVDGLAAQLAPLLEPQGLTVAARRDGTLHVHNPVVAATDPRGVAITPGLNQRIVVAEHRGTPWFFWLWPGAERGADPEPEPMVPIGQIEEAARLIGNVLRVDVDGAER